MHASCRCGVPTLYYDELCPQSRSCYMLIKLLNIDVNLHPINLINGEHVKDPNGKVNSSAIVPTLFDGQFILNNGHTIMIYLCDKYAAAYHLLCPCDYLPRLNVLNMLFYESCVLHRRYSHLMTEILLKKYPNVDVSYHRGKVIDSYNSLDTNLKGQSCMTGNCLTIADLSIVTTLSSLDLIFPILQNQWPNLHRWFGNLKTMDCYKYNNEGIQKLSQLLQTEGQFTLPSPLALEASSATMRTSSMLDNEKINSSKLKENIKIPMKKKKVQEEDKDHDQILENDNESLRKSHSPKKSDINLENVTKEKFSNFFPKIRTSKIHNSPLHTDNEAESLSDVEKQCEKPAVKEVCDSKVTGGVAADCQPEKNDCLCCCRSSVLKKSSLDWICMNCRQTNQSDQNDKCYQNENRELTMTEPTHCISPKLKNTIVLTCSAKNSVRSQDCIKVKCVEFECQGRNEDETQNNQENYMQCPCCCANRHRGICGNIYDEGELREFRSCICIENSDNCDPLCPCKLRRTERSIESNVMKESSANEGKCTDNESGDVANQECDIDCQEMITDETYENEDEKCDCEDDDDGHAEVRETTCICSCDDEDEDDTDNRFQEVVCCSLSLTKSEEDICCCDQSPIEVNKMADDLICCYDDDQQSSNDMSNDLECCCEREIQNPIHCDNTSHLTICLCDGSQAKPLDICCTDKRQSIEDCSDNTISCCCQDTSNDENYSCENEYQDAEFCDSCEAITDDGRRADTVACHCQGFELRNSNASQGTLISCNKEDYERGHKDVNVKNCCCVIKDTSCQVCRCYDNENDKGNSRELYGHRSWPNIKSSTNGFRDEPKKYSVGKCCCRRESNIQARIEIENNTGFWVDNSDSISHGARNSELLPNLGDKESKSGSGEYCTCSDISSPKHVWTCADCNPVPNRESVVQKSTTQRQGASKKCFCSDAIVDTTNGNSSQLEITDRDDLHQQETFEKERQSNFSATQQKAQTKNIHKTDDDKVTTNTKTLTDSSKEKTSPGKTFDKNESLGYEGSTKESDHRTEFNISSESGIRSGPFEEAQNGKSIKTWEAVKPQSSPQKDKATLSERKSSTQSETFMGPQKKVKRNSKTYKEIKTTKALPKIWEDIKANKKSEPKTKIATTNKDEKNVSSSSEDETEKKMPKYLPKIKTNKIVHSPSHTDHEAESSPQLEKLYEKPAHKLLPDSKVESGVEDYHQERKGDMNKSQMEWICRNCIQRNDIIRSDQCYHRMTGPIPFNRSMKPTLKDTLVLTCSAKNSVKSQDCIKVKCVEFECQECGNKDETQNYQENVMHSQNEICAYVCNKGDPREFKSCICIENSDNYNPLCPCKLRTTERNRESNEMKDSSAIECECSDNVTDDVANQECDIDCKCQEVINGESYENEDENCDCEKDNDGAEGNENNFICCSDDEDDSDNRFQEVLCCCDESNEAEICCCEQSPIEVNKMTDNLICCCDDEQQYSHNIPNDMECYCDRDIPNSIHCDNTSHLTICICDGCQAKPLTICCNDKKQPIEDFSDDIISNCWQDTDTSIDGNCSCENEYQDEEFSDSWEAITDDDHKSWCAIKDTLGLVCCCYADENGNGNSRQLYDPWNRLNIKTCANGFRDKNIQNSAAKCCCRPDISCQARMASANKTGYRYDDGSEPIPHNTTKSKLLSNLRDYKCGNLSGSHCTCSEAINQTSPSRCMCTCDDLNAVPNRESVIYKKTTQSRGRPRKCSCSTEIVDTTNWNIPKPRLNDKEGLHKHETLQKERKTFGSFKATQQKSRITNIDKTDDDIVNTNTKTLSDPLKEKASPRKFGESLEENISEKATPGKPGTSLSYEGNKRALYLRTKSNLSPVSGMRNEALKEAQNNNRITTTDAGKSQSFENKVKVPLSGRASSTQPETSLELQKKDPKTIRETKTKQALSKISDDARAKQIVAPKHKLENVEKTKKGLTESKVDAKIKGVGRETKSLDLKKTKGGEETNSSGSVKSTSTKVDAKDEKINASKKYKVGALASELANTDPPTVGGKVSKSSTNKSKEDVTRTTGKDIVKPESSKIGEHQKIAQASKNVADSEEADDTTIAGKKSKYHSKTKKDVDTGAADKQTVKHTDIKSAIERQKVKNQAPGNLGPGTEYKVSKSDDKESRNKIETKENRKTSSTKKLPGKPATANQKTANGQRASQVHRTLTAETNNKVPDRVSKQKAKQLAANSSNGRRSSRASSVKRQSIDIVPDHNTQFKTNEIGKRTVVFCKPLKLVQICANCLNISSTSAAGCYTAPKITCPQSREQSKCLKCQTKCSYKLPEESARKMFRPILECKIEEYCDPCPNQSSKMFCEQQRPCEIPADLERRQMECEICTICKDNSVQHRVLQACENSRAPKTICPQQSVSCSKVRQKCSKILQAGNCVSNSPCMGQHPIQHENHTLSQNSGSKSVNCPKKIICTPKQSARKSKRLKAGSSQPQSQYTSCDEDSEHVSIQKLPRLQAKNKLTSQQQSFFAQDVQDSTSNISQEEVTNIRHFYNSDDLKGEELQASKAKQTKREVKTSKIPRLILPKVYLVYREAHNIKPSQTFKEFSKLPSYKLYGDQDNRRREQERPMRFIPQEPKFPEILKKCCRHSPSRIPHLERDDLARRSRSGTKHNSWNAIQSSIQDADPQINSRSKIKVNTANANQSGIQDADPQVSKSVSKVNTTNAKESRIPNSSYELFAYDSKAKLKCGSINCTTCEKYPLQPKDTPSQYSEIILQPKDISRQYAEIILQPKHTSRKYAGNILEPKDTSSQYFESITKETLGEEGLNKPQPTSSRSPSKTRETTCTTNVKCCNSNGCLIGKVSRVTITCLEREMSSRFQNFENSVSSISCTDSSLSEIDSVTRNNENKPISIPRDDKNLNSLVRSRKCCHCREEETGMLRGGDDKRYDWEQGRNVSGERTRNASLISKKQRAYQNTPIKQDHQSMRTNAMIIKDRRSFDRERQSPLDLTKDDSPRQDQRASNKVNNKRSKNGSVLEQVNYSRPYQGNDNDPQDGIVHKPMEIYSYPSSQRDGRSPRQRFVVQDNKSDSNRIRGGLTDQFGNEIKSDSLVYGCTCKKYGEKDKVARKSSNKNATNDNEYCSCDQTVAKDNTSAKTESRPTTSSVSRVSKLINGPRRTITDPATSDVTKSAMPKNTNREITDTFLRVYGCSCRKSGEKKVSEKSNGKTTNSASNDYCNCSLANNKDKAKSTKISVDKNEQSRLSKKENPNPVILNVSIKSCSKDNASYICRCCREKNKTLCDDMVELSCICSCDEINGTKGREQSIDDVVNEGSSSQDEEAAEAEEHLTSQDEEGTEIEKGFTSQNEKEAEVDEGTTSHDEEGVEVGHTSQLKHSTESNTARNDQSPKEESRNMKLGQKERKSVPARSNMHTTKSIKESPKTTKERKSTIQSGDAMEKRIKEIKSKSVAEKFKDDLDNDILLTKLEQDTSNDEAFSDTLKDIPPMKRHELQDTTLSDTLKDIPQMKHHEQSENRASHSSSKDRTCRQVFRCMCGRTIPCPYRQKMRPMDDCIEIGVEKCCRIQKCKGEDIQSKVKGTINSLDKSAGESAESLETANAKIHMEDVKQTDSKEGEATTLFMTKKDNLKKKEKIDKSPTKPNGKEFKEDIHDVGRTSKESAEANGKGKKDELPATTNAIKKSIKANGKPNTLQSFAARNSNGLVAKTKAKTDIVPKNTKIKAGRLSKDETARYQADLTGTQSKTQESSKISRESAAKKSIPIESNTLSDQSSQETAKQDTAKGSKDEESNQNAQKLPENLCAISDEAFMKDFDLDVSNIPGSCDVMVVTKRTHFLKRNGAEKIEEKRLVITRPSATDLANCSHVEIPEPDSEVIKKYKRIGDKVCTITITKGNKVKKPEEKCNDCLS